MGSEACLEPYRLPGPTMNVVEVNIFFFFFFHRTLETYDYYMLGGAGNLGEGVINRIQRRLL